MNNEASHSRLPRFSKGKRPQFFDEESQDEVMSMILTLASEFSAMRDRLDTIEQIAEQKGIILADEIENFAIDAQGEARRNERRDALLQAMYFVSLKKAEELASGQDQERYSSTLEEIAEG
ncbi:MAG: hypothetical protein ABJ205_10735 [Erythrobacter sp.]|uniref:hypothetical protein n=1 Tax=Erythrobacter sp. TaxID=1042 RepID=UPI003262FC4E